MNQLTALQFPFGTACMAIGLTPEALRNWLTRKQVELIGEKTEGGHRRFSLSDIAILSVVAEMVTYGVKVRDAFNFTEELRGALAPFTQYKKTPIQALLINLHGSYIFFRPQDAGEWVSSTAKYQPGEAGVSFRHFHDFAESTAVISVLPVAGNAIRKALRIEASSDEEADNEASKQLKAMEQWLSLSPDTKAILDSTFKDFGYLDLPPE